MQRQALRSVVCLRAYICLQRKSRFLYKMPARRSTSRALPLVRPRRDATLPCIWNASAAVRKQRPGEPVRGGVSGGVPRRARQRAGYAPLMAWRASMSCSTAAISAALYGWTRTTEAVVRATPRCHRCRGMRLSCQLVAPSTMPLACRRATPPPRAPRKRNERGGRTMARPVPRRTHQLAVAPHKLEELALDDKGLGPEQAAVGVVVARRVDQRVHLVQRQQHRRPVHPGRAERSARAYATD